ISASLPASPGPIVRLAHRPAGTLSRAESPVRVDLVARTLQIHNHIHAMLSAAERIALVSPNIDIIYAGAQSDTIAGDHVIAVAYLYFGVAFAVAVEADLHSPSSYPLAFNYGVRRHVEVLNPDAIAPAAAAHAFGGHDVQREAGEQKSDQCHQER